MEEWSGDVNPLLFPNFRDHPSRTFPHENGKIHLGICHFLPSEITQTFPTLTPKNITNLQFSRVFNTGLQRFSQKKINIFLAQELKVFNLGSVPSSEDLSKKIKVPVATENLDTKTMVGKKQVTPCYTGICKKCVKFLPKITQQTYQKTEILDIWKIQV